MRFLWFFIIWVSCNAIEACDPLSTAQSFLKEQGLNLSFSELPGLTNKNYLFSGHNTIRYVIRIPGYATDLFIDRESERKNSIRAFNCGFNPARIVCFDIRNGTQITTYVEESTQLPFQDLYKKEMVCRVAHLLKRLHSSKINFQNRVDIFQKLEKLIDLLKKQNTVFPSGFYLLQQKMEEMKQYLSSPFFEQLPSHGDPVPSNFILVSGELMLLDWEHSGLNDPAWDLALLSCVVNYSNEMDQWLIQYYNLEETSLLYKKMLFFKPIIEYWLGTWGLLQVLVKETVTEKDFFIYFSSSRFAKGQRYMDQLEFQEVLQFLKEKKYEN